MARKAYGPQARGELPLCRRIEARGTVEIAARVKVIISQVYNYAIAASRAEANPTLTLAGALQTHQAKHHAAITEPAKIALLMRQIDAYPYTLLRCACGTPRCSAGLRRFASLSGGKLTGGSRNGVSLLNE